MSRCKPLASPVAVLQRLRHARCACCRQLSIDLMPCDNAWDCGQLTCPACLADGICQVCRAGDDLKEEQRDVALAKDYS